MTNSSFPTAPPRVRFKRVRPPVLHLTPHPCLIPTPRFPPASVSPTATYLKQYLRHVTTKTPAAAALDIDVKNEPLLSHVPHRGKALLPDKPLPAPPQSTITDVSVPSPPPSSPAVLPPSSPAVPPPRSTNGLSDTTLPSQEIRTSPSLPDMPDSPPVSHPATSSDSVHAAPLAEASDCPWELTSAQLEQTLANVALLHPPDAVVERLWKREVDAAMQRATERKLVLRQHLKDEALHNPPEGVSRAKLVSRREAKVTWEFRLMQIDELKEHVKTLVKRNALLSAASVRMRERMKEFERGGGEGVKAAGPGD